MRNGGVPCKFKVLSSFNAWSRGTMKRFKGPPLHKHKRWRSCRQRTWDNCTMKGKLLLFTLTTLTTLTTLGQKPIEGKYIRTDQSTCYLIINSDGTFKYRFGRDLQWDVACGQYNVTGDSIFFRYQSDMFNEQCNTEGINHTDSVGIILQFAIDKRFRPISAKLSKNKIRTNRVGDVTDPESIRKWVYYYKRDK